MKKLLTVILFFIVTSAFSQEYDDLYFNSSDRVSLKRTNPDYISRYQVEKTRVIYQNTVSIYQPLNFGFYYNWAHPYSYWYWRYDNFFWDWRYDPFYSWYRPYGYWGFHNYYGWWGHLYAFHYYPHRFNHWWGYHQHNYVTHYNYKVRDSYRNNRNTYYHYDERPRTNRIDRTLVRPDRNRESTNTYRRPTNTYRNDTRIQRSTPYKIERLTPSRSRSYSTPSRTHSRSYSSPSRTPSSGRSYSTPSRSQSRSYQPRTPSRTQSTPSNRSRSGR